VAQKQAPETGPVLAVAEDSQAEGPPLEHELREALNLVEELIERLERGQAQKTEADRQCRHC